MKVFTRPANQRRECPKEGPRGRHSRSKQANTQKSPKCGEVCVAGVVPGSDKNLKRAATVDHELPLWASTTYKGP